jgi:hypothetical protein
VVREWTAKQGMVAAGLGSTLLPGLAAGAVRPDIVVKRLRAEESSTREVLAATVEGAAGAPAVPEFLRPPGRFRGAAAPRAVGQDRRPPGMRSLGRSR